ncbi:hypothetical protein GmRootA79_11180 [Acidovorax sp. A79]
MVRAWLQGDIGGGTAHVAASCCGIAQRHNFCMGATSTLSESSAQHLTVGSGDDTTNAGIGAGKKKRLGG